MYILDNCITVTIPSPCIVCCSGYFMGFFFVKPRPVDKRFGYRSCIMRRAMINVIQPRKDLKYV